MAASGRRSGPFWVALVALGLTAAGGWRLLNLYQGPRESFTEPTRAFLSAVVARDSLRLARLGASPAVVRRALAEGNIQPLRFVISGRPRASTAQRAADTTRLTYNAAPCPLVLTFVGSTPRARLVDFAVLCPN